MTERPKEQPEIADGSGEASLLSVGPPVRVEIGLTMNVDGEWCAYGDNRPSQNHWRNSMKYTIVADVPRPTLQQVSAVCHPSNEKIISALRAIAELTIPPNDAPPNDIQAAAYRARSVAREALGIEDE